MTNFKTTLSVDCAISAGSPFPQPIKALDHWEGKSAFGQESVLPPKWPDSKIQQTLLSTNFAPLLALERQAARAPLLVTSLAPKIKHVVFSIVWKPQ